MNQLQTHIKQLYFERDQKRPMVKNVLKFIEEVGELAEAILSEKKERQGPP